ncbi:MAG: ABC transporter permease [Clostridiales Family XIII bacterium]|jgi:putative ABC transport system permease protein|nr:ABC transporter permease [Clostridiales Family XIII bacterium]
MDMFENLSLAIGSLKANKMRTLLTLLGIVIGIASVIGIMTVGSSMTDSILGAIQGMGAGNITASVQQRSGEEDDGDFAADAVLPGGRSESISVQATPTISDRVTDQMISDFRENFPDQIENISLSESVGSGQVKDGRKYANVSVTGTNSGYGAVNDIKIVNGRYIKDADISASRNVAVVSDKFAKSIFGSQEPVGEQIKIYQGEQIYVYAVIGVYESETSNIVMGAPVAEKDIRTNLYIPVSAAKSWNGSESGYMSFTIRTRVGVDTDAFLAQAQSYFDRYYARNQNFEVSVSSMESLMNAIGSILDALSLGLAMIAAISLIVGGVGIMNILLVSITERTKEIGIRKALGAKNAAIRVQFITESIIICLIGGVIGIVGGIGLGLIGSQILGFQAHPSVFTILLALGVSMLIGIFFGYYPANKAARMDPIEALRYE